MEEDEIVRDNKRDEKISHYLWCKILPEDAELMFPTATSTFMIIRDSNSRIPLIDIQNKLESILAVFDKHYPFRCETPLVVSQKHTYRNKDRKRIITHYIYVELKYDEYDDDQYILQDIMFKLSEQIEGIFIKCWSSVWFEVLLSRFYHESMHPCLKNPSAASHRVWIHNGRIVYINYDNVPPRTREFKLSRAIIKLRAGHYQEDPFLSKNRDEVPYFDALQYIYDREILLTPSDRAFISARPDLLSRIINTVMTNGFTTSYPSNTVPCTVSMSILSAFELNAMVQKQKNNGWINGNITDKKYMSGLITYAIEEYKKHNPITYGMSAKESNREDNSRLVLQKKLIDMKLLDKEIDISTKFDEQVTQDKMDEHIEAGQSKLTILTADILSGLSKGKLQGYFSDTDFPEKYEDEHEDEDEEEEEEDDDDEFNRSVSVHSSDDEEFDIIRSRLHQVKQILEQDPHDNISFERERIYFSDVNELYAQGITPKDEDWEYYYHPESSHPYYYDPETLSVQDIETYTDNSDYESIYDIEPSTNIRGYVGFLEFRNKVLQFKRKSRRDYAELMGLNKQENDGKDDEDEEDNDEYLDSDDEDNKGIRKDESQHGLDIQDQIIDVDNEPDAEVYRDIEAEKASLNRFID
ncbi:uncharacterized protein RJT21DRAFT_137305 [Scheffersomyces amazonensis]|uniref:uncharacterized protein n=1 Tax=Scheffersomyces amazonensis TaxID=1078765 RepID=UPI00315D4748